MSSTSTEAPATGPSETPKNPPAQSGQPAGQQPATPTEDGSSNSSTGETETVDYWKSRARQHEQRAKDNAAAAKRLAEIEDAQKTEAQRAAEALATERKRADEAAREALSLRIATEHHLGAEDAELLAGLPDEDAMRKLAKRLEAQAAGNGEQSQQEAPPRVGYGVDHSKTQSSPPPSDDDAARAFFGI